ncbi:MULTISPECIES: Ig-like domain-containing protein [Vibrio]|uniref:Ig-like domain-containing protein n=1 Tax=Vibrio TaxID=662 RepID=UPI0020754DF7|nr:MULTISPECIES: Ig-like domain-containing protein [Vibrio]USD32098.1 Ig-like domain-containing protein [Vibrio sp. SCSIO 43186]USD35596.1 Ig-like domain-containing protein [Vibrio sp. SCSIO 43186]USD45140.1 Ig-like domain-containing protein [Vibrio sp. SCSIO 43145]USD69222.1 Ig-like domain-containing protein [Vibrio sp. SCSIO 43139]USD72720.1 Ig-like domain-containing protein [Vibrio sp. SCSIO 43139]
MKYIVQYIFVLMALMLLAGCDSEDSQTSVDAKVNEIKVTPSPTSVLEGRTQQLIAIAKYDDGSENDVSDSVSWEIVGDPTIADVSASGLITANTKGDTEITASKDGIVSNTVKVTVCDLAGVCIDPFDTGSGRLFTNSPSVAYLDSIGGSATDGSYIEKGAYGPVGEFYLFNWGNANALCTAYNTKSLGGRTNWRLATRDELKVELYDIYGNMFADRGWPTEYSYWSMTPDSSSYYYVSLNNGKISSSIPSGMNQASCVSEP